MKMKLFLYSALTGLGLVSGAHAATIGVNFQGGGDALGAAEVAGLVPQANWNNAGGASGTVNGLLDSTGAATGVNISYAAGTTFSAHNEDDTDRFVAAGDLHLMSGYLDNFTGTTGNITFSNLGVTPYRVIVYDLESINGRGGSITVAGASSSTLAHTAATSTAYVTGVNYSDFGTVTPDANGNITITTDGSSFRIAEQGVQLISVPEPASIGLLGVGAIAAFARRRRK